MSRTRIALSLVAATLVALAFSGAVAAREAGNKVTRLPIVDKAIDFVGGDEIESSEVSLTISSKSGTFDVVVRAGGVFDYQVIRDRDGKREITRQTNDSITRELDGKPVQLDAEAAERAKSFVSARVYFLLLPYRLNDPSVYKEDLGLETWDGRELHKVKVTFEPGSSESSSSQYLYWFDPETARLEQFAYSFSGGLRLRKLFNYRRIGGILFADSYNHARDGEGLEVDSLSPEYEQNNMELLSTVRMENIEVRPR